MENNYCNKCGTCCKNIKADLEAKVLYWDGIQSLDADFESMLIPIGEGIYKCKYLKDNLCTNIIKPNICKNYPSSPFVELPEVCDYRGDIFMKKEKVLQKVRKLKEEILYYNALISTITNKKEQNQYKKIIDSHQRIIDKYKVHGSQDW